MGSAVAHTLDIDKLLWVPGQKTIFLPPINEYSKIIGLTHSQIIAMELERITPHIKSLFERDDMFYRVLSNHVINVDCGIEPIELPLKFGVIDGISNE